MVAAPVALLVPAAVVPSLAGSLSPLSWAAAALIFLIFLAAMLLRFWQARRGPAVVGPTWGCAFPLQTPRMAYTAEGFSELAHRHLLPAWIRPAIAGGAPAGLFPLRDELRQQAPDPVLRRVFIPFFQGVADRCFRLRWLQQGRLHVYLLYIFITCALLITWGILSEGRWP
jgi:hypothetical protein